MKMGELGLLAPNPQNEAKSYPRVYNFHYPVYNLQWLRVADLSGCDKIFEWSVYIVHDI